MNRQGRLFADSPRAAACASRSSILDNRARAKGVSVFALAAALALAACAAARARAASLPAGFAESQIAVGLGSPTAMAFAPDGRVFVCLQGGQLRVVKNGSLLPTPFLTVATTDFGERGLLGVAFDPNFASNRFVYVYYTATTPNTHNRVSRFTASAANPDVAEAGSEVVLLELEPLGSSSHNGGAMHFGADGKLYVATGDNASSANSQSYANKLGKILRINTDPANLIPADNPFLSRTTGTNQSIWALGLRNPFTFSVQPGTGRIFINDVGEITWEEINDGAAGANYGWPACEGNCPSPAPTPAIRPPNSFTNPVFQYAHSGAQPSGCAVTGGSFYNPPNAQFPATYAGKYFFADFCTSFIRYIDPDSPSVSTVFATGLASPVDLQVSADGSLWYLERGNTGRLMRVRFTANTLPPSITQHPQSQTVAAGASVTFTVSAVGSGTLRYQWQRNNADIPGANSQSYTLSPVSASDDGAQFRCVVTNPFGGATSNNATLTINPDIAAPGEIVVSEFRLDGPAGQTDEFVELYNPTARDITVTSVDGSAGWAIVSASAASVATYHVIPAGTVINARARYLVAGAQYSLDNYGGANAAAPDAEGANDLAASGATWRGLGLFRTADPALFTAENRLDAVGCAADPHPLLVEGAGIGPCHAVGTQAQPAADYSFARRLNSGTPQDTNNNASDFQLVAVQIPLASPAAGATLQAVLGAPGPENADSPVQRNQIIKASLLDACAGVGAPPNQDRDATFSDPPNQTRGTFTLRRRFTNNTGQSVTRLRFRIVDLTTAPAPPCEGPCDGVGDTSDLRAITSPARPSFTVTGAGCVGTRTLSVEGLTLEAPPAQTLGGGINSTLAAGTITAPTPLAPGDSVNVEFLFGVERTGFYRFFVNVEALPSPAPASAPPAARAPAHLKGVGPPRGKAATGKNREQ